MHAIIFEARIVESLWVSVQQSFDDIEYLTSSNI